MGSAIKGRELTFEQLCEIVGIVATKYGMERVYLFGSRARGDNRLDSDFDFCVLPGASCSLLKLSGFRLDLIDALNEDVDIVCEDSIRDDFIKEMMSDRKLVYGS